MDSLVEFWQGRKTVKGVLIFNTMLPGLGLIYAGGAIWTLAVGPAWVVLFYGLPILSPGSWINTYSLFWFGFSLIGSAIVWLRHGQGTAELGRPGPNTRDLSSHFGKGEGKGVTISALDTFEQKVKNADEFLKATRALELENAKQKPKTELVEPKPVAEERHLSLACETPQSELEQSDFESESQLGLEFAQDVSQFEPIKIAPPAELHSLPSFHESRAGEPLALPSEPNRFETSFAPEQVAQLVTEPVSQLSVDQSPDFQPTDVAPPADFSPSFHEASFGDSLPPASSDISSSVLEEKSIQVDDEESALASKHSPEQVQRFVEKLGETVGTSYQQEPLSKPSFDISFPSFEAPQFSFDFSDALASDFLSISGSGKDEHGKQLSEDNCLRCGTIRHSDFSFCLGCGISF